MRVLYNILTYIVTFHLKLAALFNKKLKLGIDGRTETFSILESELLPNDKIIWFHCASLGEYEQGLPVFEIIRKDYKNHKIVLSFFSPSGYEIRKNTSIADTVVYLPFDTKSNAKKFINLLNPVLVLFVKYEVWPNYLFELKKLNINTVLISALFRENQIYFKSYGTLMKNALDSFNHIFTQDENSKTLLDSINISNVSVSGDTRFDRVSNQLLANNTLDFLSEFKQNKLCVIAGSTWVDDEKLLIPLINNHTKDTKFVIAPHNIKPNQILELKKSLSKKTVLFSEKENYKLSDFNVLILDTIGLLTKAYSYADIAYVGGAMGNTGLHNILEPATFGIPIIIGKNHVKFPEAKAMMGYGLYSISNKEQLNAHLDLLINSSTKREELGKKNNLFITKNKGAVVQIVNYIRKYL